MEHNEQYTSIRRDALSQLLLVSDLMKSDMKRGLKRMGLTQVRAQVIWEVGRHQPMTQKDLADALGVTPRNVTTLLDSLESLGLVSRSPHPTDRRAIMVSLSPIGQGTLEQLHRDMTALATTLFSDMTDAELKDFVRVLAVASEKLINLAVE